MSNRVRAGAEVLFISWRTISSKLHTQEPRVDGDDAFARNRFMDHTMVSDVREANGPFLSLLKPSRAVDTAVEGILCQCQMTSDRTGFRGVAASSIEFSSVYCGAGF